MMMNMMKMIITNKYYWICCQYNLSCTKTIGIEINIMDFFKKRTTYKYENYDYNVSTFNGIAFMTSLPVSCIVNTVTHCLRVSYSVK